jgi:ATP-dependent DNA helicase RecQ
LTIHEILYRYWGFPQFRPLQEDIIQSVLDGKDTLALLPTGGGKSVCYQVPALALDGICIVVTPLIALMKDQVEQLRQKEIPALMINSNMDYKEVDNVLKHAISGRFKFLYVSPERLETKLFLEYLPAMEVCLIAVDEAHCISQWGYDFRSSYLRIAAIREELKKVPVLAVTASATKQVQKDICHRLLFSTENIFQNSFERPNISYSVFEEPSKINKTIEILKKVNGSAIVYCKSRKRTKEVCDLLQLQHIQAAHYHAGLDAETRSETQQLWIENKIRVVVCTNAFGMGIDKPDVRVVIHYDVPDCLENYYQEAGRAGRDGKKAFAVLLFRQKDLEDLEKKINLKYPAEAVIKNVYLSISNFLQLTYGSGEGQFFDFDLPVFCKAFQLDAFLVLQALKILEQEELMYHTESIFVPPTIEFTAGKETLFAFEKTHRHLEPLIKTLLRTYGGIFDYPVFINEKNLAWISKTERSEIISQLKQLHYLGILSYKPVKELPQVCFIKERLHSESFRIDEKKYAIQKETYSNRVAQMIGFVKEGTLCRSNFINSYFGAEGEKHCGVCDNCLRNKKKKTVAITVETLAKELIHLLNSQKKVAVAELVFLPVGEDPELLNQSINFLLAEEKIVLQEDYIYLNP